MAIDIATEFAYIVKRAKGNDDLESLYGEVLTLALRDYDSSKGVPFRTYLKQQCDYARGKHFAYEKKHPHGITGIPAGAVLEFQTVEELEPDTSDLRDDYDNE